MPKRYHFSLGLLFVGLAIGATSLLAGEGTKAPVSSLGAAEDASSGIPAMIGDSEFGEQILIERISNWDPWIFKAAGYWNHTSNADLIEEGELSDDYYRSSLSLSYTKVVRGPWLADAGILQESYRYNDFDDLDFDYLRGHVGFLYHLSAGDLPETLASLDQGFLFANYAYYRVSDGLMNGAVYDNHSIAFGYQQSVPLRRGHRFYYGLAGDLSIGASVPANRRSEYRSHLGYQIEWSEDLTTSFSYVGGWFDYQNADQQDWNHLGQLKARCIAARPKVLGLECELFAEAFVDYTFNDASGADQDYESLNVGGGLGLQVSF